MQLGEFHHEDRGDNFQSLFRAVPSHEEEHNWSPQTSNLGLQVRSQGSLQPDVPPREDRADSPRALLTMAPAAPNRADTKIISIALEDLAALNGQGERSPGEVAAASGIETTLAGTSPRDSAWQGLSPQRADLLSEASPVNAGPLDVAIGQFLQQLEDFGRDVRHTVAESGPPSWALAAALGAAVFEGIRRYTRRTSSRPALVAGVEQDTLTWVCEPPGGAGLEDR
jgi:hypothetical protein